MAEDKFTRRWTTDADGNRVLYGLTVEETAEALKVSTDTVLNDWRFAKAWLLPELEERSPKRI